MRHKCHASRRDLLKWGAAGATGLALASHLPLNAAQAQTPLDVGRKFDANGHVIRFAGNTVICHLPQQGPNSAPFGVMLDYFRAAPGFSFAHKVALLPPSSYHMTVIGGANDIGRNPKTWPSGIAIDASIDDCSRIVGERLRAASLPPVHRIRMKVDADDTGFDGNTLRIPLEPQDKAELDLLEDLRAALAVAIGFPAPARGTYQFHMTLAYLTAPFSDAEKQDAVSGLAMFKRRMIERAPIIKLGTPEYCTFDDMFAFKRQLYLGQTSEGEGHPL